MIDGEERVFFFEKKKQKTFTLLAAAFPDRLGQVPKVFWFFFSKKNGCLAFFVFCFSSAQAQSVDYGSLEQMFGEPITTSATGKPQRASDVPADMVILTQDDIRRSGATSIPEILQFVTGIDVRQYSLGDTEVAVRGYDAPLTPRLLVLVDGRQVYNDLNGFEQWNSFPVRLEEIRQIEIVKGPNAALFGFNAAGGVINIVTFDPLLDKTNVATVSGGTQGYGRAAGVATVHVGTTAGVRVSVEGWTSNDFEPAGVSAPTSRYANYNIDGRWQALPWLLLNASGGYTYDRYESALPVELLVEQPGLISFLRGGAKAQTAAGTLEFDIYHNQELQSFLGTKASFGLFDARLSDLVKLDADDTVRIGAEYRRDSVSSTGAPAFPGTLSSENFAVSAMWNRQVSTMVDLTLAVRLDSSTFDHVGPLLVLPGRSQATYDRAKITAPSFNSGVVVHLSDADTLRLTAARGLQLPPLNYLGLQLPAAPTIYDLGVPDLRPESVWNAEVSYDRSLTAIRGMASGSVFFQRNTNVLAPPGSTPVEPVGGLFVSTAQNIGSSNAIGIEAAVHGATAGGFRWNASYRYESISEDLRAGVTPSEATGLDNGTPLHVIIAGVGYTKGAWELDAAGRFQTGFTDYTRNSLGAVVPFPVPDYATFNVRIGYRVTPHLTLALTAQQLDAARIVEASGYEVARRFILSARYEF
jgi:iron complex outermembrane receptor protein